MAEYVTPLMQQFAAIKAEYPDCLILFRLGDFYELFAEDAQIGAALLDITLTRKAQSKGGDVPMAGVPYHALEMHLPKLVAAGHKVAIVEQLEPADGRTLVTREVVRIITPGTVLSSSVLTPVENRYCAALVIRGEGSGPETDPPRYLLHPELALALADLSTGDILFSTYSPREDTDGSIVDSNAWLQRELERFLPAELIVHRTTATDPALQSLTTHLGITLTTFGAWEEWTSRTESRLLEHLNVRTLEPFGLENNALAQQAVSVLIGYAHYTQRQAVPHLRQIKEYTPEAGLQLDAATQRNLELFTSLRHQDKRGTLLKHLDQNVTALGSRTLRGWLSRPQADLSTIESRLDSVEELINHPSHLNTLRTHLKEIGDIERLTSRVTLSLGSPRDVIRLGTSLQAAIKLAQTLQAGHAVLLTTLHPDQLTTVQRLADQILQTLETEPPNDIKQGSVIKPGVSAELDRWRTQQETQQQWMMEYEQRLRQETGISTLKVRSNKVFGFYIEVSRAAAEKVPDSFERKQTLVNGERSTTPELKEQERTLFEAEAKILALEIEMFEQLVSAIRSSLTDLQSLAKQIGTVDALTALAVVAQQQSYIRPVLHQGGELEIIAGRHPVVEALLEAGDFVPNDTVLDPANSAIKLLTGPNMGGKSVYLRQTALITLLAHIGSFVPADSARIPVTDRIFVRSGAADNIADGLSTFMVEMVETASILRHGTARSLILLDEVGRGTSTYDGLSLAWAIVEHLATQDGGSPKTIFATHYLELQQLAELHPQVSNVQVAVHQEADQVVFLHQVQPGGAAHSFGVRVAAMAGVPKRITERATELLQQFEAQDLTAARSRAADRVTEEIQKIDLTNATPAQLMNQIERWQKILSHKK